MQEQTRARRTALLCLYCVGNIAGYRAGWTQEEPKSLRIGRDFWVRANGNFLDIAVLEWCKLFAERDGKHHWKRCLLPSFRQDLLEGLATTPEQFKKSLKVIKAYRDKHVAHLDDVSASVYPGTEFMLCSVRLLYQALVTKAEQSGHLDDAPTSVENFYQERLAAAQAEVLAASMT